jgi:integrase
LRHSFLTRLRKAGVQESIIMQITGHSTREMFDRYNAVDLDDMKEAVSKFG